MTFQDGVSGASVSASLAGSGVAPASLVFTEAMPFAYPDTFTNSGSQHTFTLRNTGQTDATSLTVGSINAPFYNATAGANYSTCSFASKLAAGASCTFVISFTPRSVGAYSQNIPIQYWDGSATQTVVLGLRGNALLAPAQLVMINQYGFQVSSYAFPGTLLGNSSTLALTVKNTGLQSATSIVGDPLAAPFSWPGGSYPGTGGTCGSTLAPGASCQLVVAFAPTELRTYTTNVTLSYFDAIKNTTYQASLAGAGANPVHLNLYVTQPILNGVGISYFVAAAPGQTRDIVLEVYSTGPNPASDVGAAPSGLAAPFDYKGGAFPGTGGTCTTSIGVNQTCTVVLSFSPTAAGYYESVFTLSYAYGTQQFSVSQKLGAQSASSGIPDASFGANASAGLMKFSTTIDGFSYLFEATNFLSLSNGQVLGWGKLLRSDPVHTAYQYLAAARFNADGTLDTSFGTAGFAWVPIQGTCSPASNYYDPGAIQLDAHGRIVVSATEQQPNQGLLARFSADGILDATFNGVGFLTGAPASFVTDSAGGILYGSAADTGLSRLNEDGSRDTGFSTRLSICSSPFGAGMKRLADGRIVGMCSCQQGAALFRLNADGSLDASFGDPAAGGVILSYQSPAGSASSFAVDAANRIVVGTRSVSKLGVERFQEDGSPDLTFGTSGLTMVGIPDFDSWAYMRDILIAADGKILVDGSVSNAQLAFPVILRLNGDGTLDKTWAATGWSLQNFFYPVSLLGTLTLSPGGQVLQWTNTGIAAFTP